MKIQTGWRKSPSIRVVLAANSVLQLALELPMRHEYGNGVAIFTRDGNTARDFACRVNVGMVSVNVPIPVPVSYYTFGDLNQFGADAFRFYTRTKTVTSHWSSGVKEGASFVIPTMS